MLAWLEDRPRVVRLALLTGVPLACWEFVSRLDRAATAGAPRLAAANLALDAVLAFVGGSVGGATYALLTRAAPDRTRWERFRTGVVAGALGALAYAGATLALYAALHREEAGTIPAPDLAGGALAAAGAPDPPVAGRRRRAVERGVAADKAAQASSAVQVPSGPLCC